MHRPSSIEPFTPSPTVTLHPLLQSVLDNLDIQIDEELTRYRRQRRYPTDTNRSRKPFSPAQTSASAKTNGGTSSSLKAFDLKSAAQSTGASPSSTAIGILDNTIQRPTPRSSIYAEYAEAPETASIREAQPTEPRRPFVEQTTVQGARIAPPPALTAPSVAVESESRISSYAEQNDLSLYAPSETLQKLMQTEAQAGRAPEDYLASSEELLRSIAEEDVALRAEREPNSMLETLLTPLGIGSMLLLLLSSTTLGYVIMNPTSLGWRTASQPKSSASTASPSGQDAAAPSPDLASEEFVDLGLDTLSTLPKPERANSTAKPKAASAKPNAASPAPNPANATSNKAASGSTSRSAEPPLTATFDTIPVAPVPAPMSTVVVPSEPPIVEAPVPAPVYQPAAPAPTAVLPEPITEPITTTPPPLEPTPEAVTATAPTLTAPASPGNYYYVVTEYSGDTSLQEARGAVPDAYVRNLPEEGAKVQMGAFSDETKAQELLQELENQGIEAEVYRP